MKKNSVQFCPQGHNTLSVGRSKYGSCKKCSKNFGKIFRQQNPEYAKIYNKKYYEKNHVGLKHRSAKYYQQHKKEKQQYNWKYKRIINSNSSQFTQVDYDRLYQIQQGKCVICKRHRIELRYDLHVDHDHQTGIVRGLLCINCNTWLGWSEKFNSQVKKYLRKKHTKKPQKPA